jgi:hypothetical protein
MRGALAGLLGMLAAIPVYWGLRLLRVKHDWEFEELAGLMIGAVPVAVTGILLVCVIWTLAIFKLRH